MVLLKSIPNGIFVHRALLKSTEVESALPRFRQGDLWGLEGNLILVNCICEVLEGAVWDLCSDICLGVGC